MPLRNKGGIMSGHHNFLVLKVYGTKIGKFKQGVLLPAANATIESGMKLLSDKDLETVRTGACLSITMAWLKSIIKGKTLPYADKPNDQNAKLIKLAALMGKRHATLKSEVKNSTPHQVRMDLAKALGVPLEESRCLRDTTFGKAMNAVSVLKQGQGALVSSKVYRHKDGGYIGRHATGFHVNKHGCMRFFDPNVGEYEILLKDAPDFFDAYQQILAERLNQDFVETDLYMATLN